jgi:hypothetical protein
VELVHTEKVLHIGFHHVLDDRAGGLEGWLLRYPAQKGGNQCCVSFSACHCHFLKVYLHHFPKIKSQTEVKKTAGIKGFLTSIFA